MELRRVERRRAFGFSLLELMILMGIIALLAVLLLSGLNRAREMSRRTACLSNLRQLTQAWHAYAADNDDRLCASVGNPQWLLFDPKLPVDPTRTPVAHDPLPLIPNGQLWPYLKNRAPYICPTDPQLQRNTSPSPPGVLVAGGTGTSYSMNLLLGMSQNTDLMHGMPSLHSIRNAAQLMVFYEGNDGWLSDTANYYAEINSFHPSTSGSIGVIGVSFADGHAMMWQLIKWGGEQRSWVAMGDIDNVQFGAFLVGADSPEQMQ